MHDWEGRGIYGRARHQPECRHPARRLLAPANPARYERVLGAGRLVLVSPRVAEEGGHLPHRCRHRLGRQLSCAGAHPKPRARQVCGEQSAAGQAPEELRGAIERGIGVAAADERRDRRRLFRLCATCAQTPQAVVDAAAVAGRGEGGAQKTGDAQGRFCPVIEAVVSLHVVCDAARSGEHTDTQETEAKHGPQPPQGGTGLHGAIAAAAQRGDERACRREGKCGQQEANPGGNSGE